MSFLNRSDKSLKSGKSFKYLDELIHSGAKEIILDSDIVLDENESSQYSDGIELDIENLIIDGNGHAIDACGKARIFHCSKNVQIKNMTLKNGKSSKGGAIFNEGQMNIRDCEMTANTASDGGAIFNECQMNLRDCEMTANTASSGGAIYCKNGILSITESTLNENTTKSQGGAIYNHFSQISITKSTFNENTVLESSRFKDFPHGGGAIRNTGGEMSISQSTLSKNTSKENGAAIDNNLCQINITDSIFSENTAEKSGGAIHNYSQGKINISECALSKNTAKDQGGAICNGHPSDSPIGARVNTRNKNHITVRNCSFEGNSASLSGGAIHNRGSGNLSINESEINENATDETVRELHYVFGGGAMYNDGEMTIDNTRMQENSSPKNGGAISNGSDGKLGITQSSFIKNTSSEDGGAIRNRGEVTIDHTQMQENASRKNGGAIENEGRLSIEESSLTKNTSDRDGAAISNNKSFLTVSNCNISNNISKNNIILNNANMEIHHTVFSQNESGHIIVNADSALSFTIISGEFRKNAADGAIIFNAGKTLHIEKTVFENHPMENDSNNIINKSDLTLKGPKIKDEGQSILNHGHILLKENDEDTDFEDILSRIYGEGTVETDRPSGNRYDFSYLDRTIHESESGKIILEEDILIENYERDFYEGGIELDIDNLIIDGNGKTIDGGQKSRIFIITASNIRLENITFKNGHAHMNYHNPYNAYGGAIKINGKNDLSIKNCRFIKNQAEKGGGAIKNNEGKLTITKSALDENMAEGLKSDDEITSEKGGAIHNSGEMSISRSALSNNTAHDGGAIYNNNNSSADIKSSTISRNTAKNNGGAIKNNEGKISITNCEINENMAKNDGGAIHDNKGDITITNTEINKNTAENDGGVIVSWTGRVIITESTMNENTARNGGAIKNSNSYLESGIYITKSALRNNRAEENGGAICNSGTLDITESAISNNTTENDGGAIWNHLGHLNITKSTLSNNTAKNDGGAIHKFGFDATIAESEFNENTAGNNGGAIFHDTISISNSSFSKNSAGHNGGAIYHTSEGKVHSHGTRACEDGGELYEYLYIGHGRNKYEDYLTLVECKFKDNKPNDLKKDKLLDKFKLKFRKLR